LFRVHYTLRVPLPSPCLTADKRQSFIFGAGIDNFDAAFRLPGKNLKTTADTPRR
jgi:hypothetical protein